MLSSAEAFKTALSRHSLKGFLQVDSVKRRCELGHKEH